VRSARPLALLAALLGLASGCATARAGARLPSSEELEARLSSRAASYVGERGPFQAGGERFVDDCSGFTAAVYAAEGIPLRQLMARAAPAETSGVAAAHQAARSYGVVFGGGGEWPRPGDLVFFRDTYDRNRNGAVDDVFTHVGVVERVDAGTITFVHRGGRAVARGALTLERPDVPTDGEGRLLNSTLRDKRPRLAGEPVLAGQLFQGFGRILPDRIPGDLLR
jgi:hypothetical protein